MDNLTHTLFGLCLAKMGLERSTPLATATLVISSNLPDVDTVMRLGGSLSNLEYHRGLTHSFLGLAVLAGTFTLGLVWVDARFRTRRDPFRRPIMPGRVFWLACLGGLGHTFMDWTNSYGVRPLMPFSDRWFYGDLAFVVDPWIWLILGSAVVWLTATNATRSFTWLLVATAMALLVAFGMREPSQTLSAVRTLPVSGAARIIWFAGLAIVLLGAMLRWRRMGPSLAKYALFLLALYYAGMWWAKQSALEQARNSPPAPGVVSVSVWPAPGNPLLWQSVAATNQSIYARYIRIDGDAEASWQELPPLEPRFAEAVRHSHKGKVFLDFARYVSATVEGREGGYTLALRDPRFPLRMTVMLSADLDVESTDFRWF